MCRQSTYMGTEITASPAKGEVTLSQHALSQHTIRYEYDIVYLTCSTKQTCSQLSPPHGTNRKIKRKNELKIN